MPFPPEEARPACHPLCTSPRHDAPWALSQPAPPTGCGERPGLAGKCGSQPADWPRLAGARGSLGILRWRVCPPTPPAGRRLTPLVPRKGTRASGRALPRGCCIGRGCQEEDLGRQSAAHLTTNKDWAHPPARGPIAQAHVPCAAGRSCSVRDISLVCARMKTALCRWCLLAISVLPSACVCVC